MILRHASMLALAAALLLAAPWSADAATTYRCEREDGSIEYSNRPCEEGESEEVELPEVNTFQGRPPARRSVDRDDEDSAASGGGGGPDQPAPAFAGYREFRIAEPTQDKVFWNMGGQISVSVAIQPRLQVGHGIVMYLDGQQVNSRPEVTTSFQLQEVWPVTHTVRAEVVEIESGRVLRTTPDVQFHVRQRSVN